MRAREFLLRENTQGDEQALAQSQKIIQQTKQAFRQKFGVDIKSNSEHRDRAKQADLFRRWQQGEPGIYIPVDPSKYPTAKYFHLFSMDINPRDLTQQQRTWLRQNGWQLTLGARDPVHWQYVSAAPPGTSTTGTDTSTSTSADNTSAGADDYSSELSQNDLFTAMSGPEGFGKMVQKYGGYHNLQGLISKAKDFGRWIGL